MMPKKNMQLCILFVLMISLSLACSSAQDAPLVQAGPSAGLVLKDTSGNDVSLSNYIGKKPVILFFWTTWCPFCLVELRALNQMQPQLSKDGIEILAVNINEPHAKVNDFIKSYSIIFKVFLDENAEAAESYGIVGIPTYLLIDKKGTVRLRVNNFPRQQYKIILD